MKESIKLYFKISSDLGKAFVMWKHADLFVTDKNLQPSTTTHNLKDPVLKKDTENNIHTKKEIKSTHRHTIIQKKKRLYLQYFKI